MRPVLATALVVVLTTTACAPDGDAGAIERIDAPAVSATASSPSSQATTTPPRTAATPPPNGEVVPLEAVLDGDSLAVMRDGQRTEVRLAGINTPESDECYGDAARSLMQDLAVDEVILVPVDGEDDRDQFGRLLRDVWVEGTWLNLLMVETGAALALQTGNPGEARLIAAEDAAWQAGQGMWGSAVCGGFPPGLRINDVRYDPPGRDFENQEEEFVLMANEGDATIDLSGWIVRDESSTHRYVFPDGLVLSPGGGVRLSSGCGADTDRVLYWCADDAVWSNGGDTVIVQTPDGTVVDRLKYPGDF